jgi:undecaprenyl-diphosphatase
MPNYNLLDTLGVFGAEYLYIALLAIALAWYLMQPRAAQIEMIAWGVVALPVMAILLVIAGIVYFDPRPFVSDNVTSLIAHAPDNGFPSDHTLLCSATSSIVLFYNRWFSALLWLLTGLVGASRVYTGIHHPLDIFASMIMAVSVALLVWYFVLPVIKRSPRYVW